MRKSPRARFEAKIQRSEDGCWLWLGSRNRRGYGYFYVNGGVVRAHRAAWEFANGPIPDGLLVCHTCDNPPCVRPDHLWLGTYVDNARDRDAKGRMPVRAGEAQSAARLTEDAVRQIRASKLSQPALARQFGVSQRLIWAVLKGESWRHVT